MKSRRLPRLIVALAALTGFIAIPAQALGQEARDRPSSEIARLLRTGRDIDAVQFAKKSVETAPHSEWQSVFRLAAQTCITTMDADCARDVLNMVTPSLTSAQAFELQPSTRGYVILLGSFFQVMTEDYHAKLSGPGFPNPAVNPTTDPVLFAELNLLAAKQSRLLFDFEASRDYLDKALTITLSLQDKRFDASRLVVRIVAQLVENYDVERAVRLVAAAMPLLQTIPPDSFLAYEFLQVVGTLAGHRKAFDLVSTTLHLELSRLEHLQLEPAFGSYLKSAAYNDLLGVTVLRGDHDAARKLLQSHPLASAKPAILKRGYFADANEFNFALAEEFVGLTSNDPTETGWGDLMRMTPRWTKDPEIIQQVQAFGQAAIGLQFLKAGKEDEGRRELVEAGKKRLSILQKQFRKSIYASPLPYWTDQVLLEIALAAALSGATPDYEFVVQAQATLSRSVETSPDVALATQAIQRSDERRRIAQSLRTIDYQQMDWERSQMADLAKRLVSPERPDSDLVSKSRLQILDNGREFIRQRQRLRTALLGDSSEGVDSVAHLATLKGLLLPEEALVFHAPILGSVGKVCIRADQTLSTIQAMDGPAVARDARLLRAALTATHPASIEADSQFPAAEAVRLGKVLFGGLEKCLRSSRRIYVVATAGDLGLVPPAVLLSEMPPVMGAGFDLRAAHWMIRDHSFVRTTSIDAFVATKRLSKRKRGTLDYLGVGDPTLEPRGAAPPSGTLNTLPELPETSEELERVASQFNASKVRILRRESASEEEFRLQPLSEFDVIHFATHGLIREEQPGLHEPSLVLTPNPAGDPFDDGLLTSSQIAALPLRARLVVLSACNSARYDASIIDSGIQGLSTSFAVAGVPSMIASLWPIESSLTRDLIVATFQAARSRNIAIADALAIAVRKHLNRPGPRPLLHPRFWAALVVLGDGSMTLNSPAESHRRDLGAFVPAKSSNGDDILSATILDGDFITSTIGAWNGKRSPSLIRRQTAGGTVKWQVEDGNIGAGLVAAGKQMIYAGGYISSSNGAAARTVPVLRGLTADGKVLWSHQIRGSKSTLIWGLAVDADQSALAFIGPSLGDRTGAVFSLSRIGKSGTEVAHMAIATQGDSRFGQSGYFAVDNDAGLAVISRNARPTESVRGFNWLGVSRVCWQSDAEIVFVDLPHFKEERRIRINGVRVRHALAVRDGWILAGDLQDGCELDAHAVAYKVNSDGTVAQLWRDSSPFDTFARGLREVDGGIQIVGYAKRSVGIHEESSSIVMPDFASRRSGDEAYISGELFSVRLSERGAEERRDFVGAGFPVIPMGMTSTVERSAIFGSIASRALWMAF